MQVSAKQSTDNNCCGTVQQQQGAVILVSHVWLGSGRQELFFCSIRSCTPIGPLSSDCMLISIPSRRGLDSNQLTTLPLGLLDYNTALTSLYVPQIFFKKELERDMESRFLNVKRITECLGVLAETGGFIPFIFYFLDAET